MKKILLALALYTIPLLSSATIVNWGHYNSDTFGRGDYVPNGALVHPNYGSIFINDTGEIERISGGDFRICGLQGENWQGLPPNFSIYHLENHPGDFPNVNPFISPNYATRIGQFFTNDLAECANENSIPPVVTYTVQETGSASCADQPCPYVDINPGAWYMIAPDQYVTQEYPNGYPYSLNNVIVGLSSTNDLIGSVAICGESYTGLCGFLRYWRDTSVYDHTLSFDISSYSEQVVEPCGITNLTQCFKDALSWAFVPSDISTGLLSGTWSSVRDRPPFGYFSLVIAGLEGINASTSPAFALQSTPFLDDLIFTPIRDGILWLLYIFLSVSIFIRMKNIIV